MQTVFEDGPAPRPAVCGSATIRLQALTNYVTFRNNDLVKRCLYLFAGLPREDGLVAACVYDDPRPACGRQYIMDYSALYGAAVLDYVRATRDLATARELWPVVQRQMEILGRFINADGVFVDPGGWWLFIELARGARPHRADAGGAAVLLSPGARTGPARRRGEGGRRLSGAHRAHDSRGARPLPRPHPRRVRQRSGRGRCRGPRRRG